MNTPLNEQMYDPNTASAARYRVDAVSHESATRTFALDTASTRYRRDAASDAVSTKKHPLTCPNAIPRRRGMLIPRRSL